MALRGKQLSLSARENIDGYVFILPWIIGFLFLNAFPMFYSLYLAFTKWNIVGKVHWAGLTNFKRMFDMSRSLGVEFRKSVLVTFYFTALSIPLKIIWSITLALLLHKAVSFRRFFVSIFYLPAVISGVSTALMWKWIFDERKGFINNLLALLGVQGPNWFGQTSTAIPAFTFMGFWGTGFMVIIYLGALQSIPNEIEESCELDGAGPFRKLFGITLPMISPVIMYQVVRGIISSFQVFMTAYVISGGHDGVALGGPNDAYLFYVLNLYKQAFINLRMGYASALAWFLFGIIFLFTLFIFKSSPLWTFYRSGERD